MHTFSRSYKGSASEAAMATCEELVFDVITERVALLLQNVTDT
jgi:hypothetical protein